MLRKETVEPGTLELLKNLVALPQLSNFRLVGGTALSLLFGHRKSIDLDFFTDEPFEKEVLIDAIENSIGRVYATNDRFKNILQCTINNIKVDFVSVRDPFLNPPQIIGGIPLADIKDLIALKPNAIKGRGVKKDFWDVAMLLQSYTLENLFQFYHDRYVNDDTFAVIRSIIYFDDAEDTITPESLNGMTWQDVKGIITKAFDDYYRNK